MNVGGVGLELLVIGRSGSSAWLCNGSDVVNNGKKAAGCASSGASPG